MASGSAPSVAQPIVGTLGFPAAGVGPPGIGNLACWDKVVLVGCLAKEVVLCQEVLVRDRSSVEVSLVGTAMGGMRVSGPTGRDQTYTPQGEATSRKGGGAKGGGEGVGVLGAGVGRVWFEELPGAGDGLDAVGEGGVQDPWPVGPVLSHRDQALNALKVCVEVLGPQVGPQVIGMVEGCCPRSPPSLFLPHPRTLKWWLGLMSFMVRRRGCQRRWRRLRGGWKRRGLRFQRRRRDWIRWKGSGKGCKTRLRPI